jgi:apolipoprotein N-acyltransferase
LGDGPGLVGDGEAVTICKDMDFQGALRDGARRSAGALGLMLVPAWDFDADDWTHARMAILRGVEGGYAIVRAASNGLVTVSDARGRVLARRPSGAVGYASVVAAVPRGAGNTPYLRIGDAFGWIAGLAGVLLMAWSILAAPRRL